MRYVAGTQLCRRNRKAADPGSGSAAWRLPMTVGCQQVGGLQARVPGKSDWTRPRSPREAPVGAARMMAARSRTRIVVAAPQPAVAPVVDGRVAPKAGPEMGMPKADGVRSVIQSLVLFTRPPPSGARAPTVPGS